MTPLGVRLFQERLRIQHISGAPLRRVLDVVSWLTAVQSQDYAGAKWSIGQRLRNGTDAEIDQAFNSGSILRTHILRPTWHFVAPADIRWMLQVTAPHVIALNGYQYRKLELDASVFARTRKIITQALQGEKHLTRAELAVILREAGIVARNERLAAIVMQAELEGLVCSGALRGKQHTYALLEERVPPAPPLTADEALAELTHRFFLGHAPATLKQFIWWSGLSTAKAKAGLALVRSQLLEELIDGDSWFRTTRTKPMSPGMTAYLLPEYDEVLVGTRDMPLPDLPRSKHVRTWRDVFLRPLVIEGRRAGTWKRTFEKGAAQLELNLFASLSRAQMAAVQKVAERFGRFLELPVSIAR